MLGVTSVGSGALIGLALILVFQLTPHRVVGTDVFHAAILLWAAGLAHLVGGNVDFALMGTILIGSLPGVWIGTALIDHVPADVLRPALGCVLLGSALGVLTKAGVDVPPPCSSACPCPSAPPPCSCTLAPRPRRLRDQARRCRHENA